MFEKRGKESAHMLNLHERAWDLYYREGKTQGELRASQRVLITVVDTRFPDLTELAQKEVELCNDANILEILFMQILTAPDVTVAQWLLESMSEWTDCFLRPDR